MAVSASGDGKTFFNDFECADTVYYGDLFAINLTAGYLLCDFYVYLSKM